jgi:hypothetical protein
MNRWNRWVRQIHRWMSILFTLTVIANIVGLAVDRQSVWVGFAALVPLVLLLASGLYLFVLPYVTGRVARETRIGETT